MKHRERVNMALEHREPDRVPLDMWGTDSRLIDDFYFKVLEHLGWEEKGDLERPGKTAQYVDYRLSDLFGCDFRHITAKKPAGYVSRKEPDGTVYDEWGIGYQKMGEHSFISHHPFPEPDPAAIEKHPWPDMNEPTRFEGMRERVWDWYENTDYAITTTTPVSGLIMDVYQYLRGTESFFTDMYMEKDFAHALIAKIAEVMETLYVNMVRPIGDWLTWVEFASDYGTQNAPFIPVELYREFLKEPESRIFASVRKEAPQAKIYMHSCGSVKQLIPDLIEAGVDILSSLQPLAYQMDSAELKKEFGSELVFHGGIDLQQALVGTREQSIRETLTRLRDYAPGGGYICAPSNHLTSDVPVENFFALYETAMKFRIEEESPQ